MNSSTYIVKVKVSHYVKLHFVRGLSLPNLQSIKQLEAEYNNLPFPALAPLGWPIGVTGFFGIGLLGVMSGSIPSSMLPGYLLFVALGAFWIFSRLKKRKAATEQRSTSFSRANEILAEAGRLTDLGGHAASAD